MPSNTEEMNKEAIIQDASRVIYDYLKKGRSPFPTPIDNMTPGQIGILLTEFDVTKPDYSLISVLVAIGVDYKISSRWMEDRLILGVGVVGYVDTPASRLKAWFTANLIHIAKFKDVFAL